MLKIDSKLRYLGSLRPTVIVLVFLLSCNSFSPAFANERISDSEAQPINLRNGALGISPEESNWDLEKANNAGPGLANRNDVEINGKEAEKESTDVENPMALDSTVPGSMGPNDLVYQDNLKLVNVDHNSGALSYDYDIPIPNGRNGFQPTLKLVYNSQNDEEIGLLGYGWSLNIPSVSRFNKKGVDFLYTDNYFNSSLSGELVQLGPTTFSSKADVGDFLSYSFINNSWLVTSKNGTAYKFGASSSSRQDDPNDSTRVYKWMLEEYRDSNNNYIRYEYQKESGQIYPSRITYSNSGAVEGVFEIIFTTETRADNIQNSSSGFKITTNLRIKEIETKINGVWDKKYTLSFTPGANSKRSLLASIVESAMDETGSVLVQPPQLFTYQAKDHGWQKDNLYSIPLGEYNQPILFANENSNDNQQIQVVDINGDGLVDFLESRETWPTFRNAIYINQGNGSWQESNTWTIPADINPSQFMFSASGQNQGYRITDVNGDNLPDILKSRRVYGEVNGVVTLVYENGVWINKPKSPDLLSEIIDPRGNNISISYKTTPLYKNGSIFLNPSLPLVLQTVSQITVNDGINSPSSTTYEYENGRTYYNNPFDHKFAGFYLVTASDPLGNKTRIFYHQGDITDASQGEYSDHFSKIGKPYRIEKTDSNGNLYSAQINKWENVDLGNGANFVKNTQTIEMTYDGNSTHRDKATTYTYNDTNGNLTQQTEWGEVNGQDNGTFTDIGNDKFTTNISYAVGSTLGVTGAPSDEVTLNQSGTKVKQTRHYYDLLALGSVEKGNETKTEFWKTGSTFINTQKTYNSLGLVTQEKDPRGKITNYTYDAFNLYPVTVSKPHQVVNNYLYDYSSGQIKQTTDPNGFVFQTVYDGLDRVVEEKQPDASNPSTLVTKATYSYTNLPVGEIIQKVEYLNGSQSRSTYEYTDGLGRVIQTRTQSEDPNFFVVKDVVYNSLGLVDKESLPYFSNGSARTSPTTIPALYSTYTYDPPQRITSVTNAVGSTTNIYDDWKTTVIDSNNIPKHLYKDAAGNLIKVEEVNGASVYSTNYEYNYLGNLTKITDALGNIRNFTYDGLGQRLTAQDLHAVGDSTFSTWTYTYDASGNITKVVDGKAQTINYTFDDLNRVLTENFAGLTGTEVVYVYNGCVKGIGKLCSVTVLNGPVTAYEYDALGNVSKETKTIDSVSYATWNEYDRLGNLVLITNPDNSQVKYEYNLGGQIEKVQRKENTDAAFADVVVDFDYGPHGKVTSQENANSTVTTNTYDDSKLYRLARKQTITQNGSAGNGGTAPPVTVSFGSMAGDGTAYKDHTDWNTARGFATGTVNHTNSTVIVKVGKQNETTFRIQRSYLAFDTSSLPDNAVVTDAKLKLYAEAKINQENDEHDWVSVVAGQQASGTSLVAADYGSGIVLDNPTEGIDASERKDITDIALNQYLVFNLNASGKSWVSDSGVSKFALREGHDLTNTVSDVGPNENSMVRFRSLEYSGTSYDPVLEVTYTEEIPGSGSPVPKTIQDVSYSYDNNGNVLSITDASETDTAKVSAYTYDDLNRLLSATVTNAQNGDNTTKTYSYSAIGNITASSDAGAYTYGGSTGTNYANPHAVTGLNGATLNYDRNGNLSGDGTWTNVWDYNNRLVGSQKTGADVSYLYDHTGQRVKLNNGMANTVYPSRMYNTDGATAQKHIFADDVLVATVRGTGASVSVSLDHTDHLTGTGVVTDDDGSMVQLLDYHPFGTFRVDWKVQGTVDEQRKFAGHEHDVDTGLSYMNARYYNAQTGKFTSIDPAYLKLDRLEVQLVDPQSWNSYAYARSNPLKYNDPDGEFWDTVIDLGFTAFDGARTVQHLGNWLGDKASVGLGKALGNRQLEASGRKNSVQSSAALKSAAADLAIDVGAAALPGVTPVVGRVDNIYKSLGQFSDAKKSWQIASKIASGHGFDKHILGYNNKLGKEFGNIIQSRDQYAEYIQSVMNNPTYVRNLKDGRTAFFDKRFESVIMHNPKAKDLGTAFRADPSVHGFSNNRDYFFKGLK